MATGGTIPTKREQSISFYNTTGVIEKDKNMYFCPRFSQAGGTVKSKYLDKFNVVCPPSSVYTDIDVSSWSPQDRSLLIRGNVDDFRTVTDEGTCLNYFIITRKVTKNDNVYTYYYAFFITGVSQDGGSSIRLTVVPDDFTNVFYLHNNDTVIVGYEPFNLRLKNCYVNRQHYNRFQDNDENFLNVFFETSYISDMFAGQTLQLYINGNYIANYTIISYDYLGNGYQFKLGYVNYDFDTSIFDNFSSCYFYYHGMKKDVTAVSNASLTPNGIIPSRNRVFLSQEEIFKFKYQYRDLKYPLHSNANFTNEEIDIIKNQDSFTNLSSDLRKKIILSSLSYVVIETKSLEALAPYFVNTGGGSTSSTRGRGSKISNTYKPNVNIAYPFMIVPKQFKKYESELLSYVCKLKYVYDNGTYQSNISLYPPFDNANNINLNGLADFLYSVYLVDSIGLKSSDFEIDYSNKHINIRLNNMFDYSDGFKAGALKLDVTQNVYGITLYYSGNTITSMSCVGLAGILIDNVYSSDYKLSITYKDLSNLKNIYFDPVLEAEPYSFYSLSFSSNEIVFDKNRYIDFREIKLKHYMNYNNGCKFVYAPQYTIDNIEDIYYTEGMTFTSTTLFPMVSDSFSQYYYQNMSQMKNQFAVEDYNFRTDQLQNFFVTSPNKVGNRATKEGGYGALAQTGVEIMGWIDNWIDHNQTKHVIGMNQEAKLADMGRKPDNLKQVGSDVFTEITTKEYRPFFNHYTIDELSYNSIAKLYERIGYQVNLYSELNTMDRVGWNFIQLNSFDFNPEFEIMSEQENNIRALLSEGVTLLHDKSYLTSGHNYETILDE